MNYTSLFSLRNIRPGFTSFALFPLLVLGRRFLARAQNVLYEGDTMPALDCKGNIPFHDTSHKNPFDYQHRSSFMHKRYQEKSSVFRDVTQYNPVEVYLWSNTLPISSELKHMSRI
jgi:hypothetical protein